jgi:TfoX/Sxy family transcriptional regulator of competence genes
MAYNEQLAQRIRTILANDQRISEKRMFGGIAFLLDGKMCCGVMNDVLVARVSADDHAQLLKKPHVRPMDFTGRPLKGFLYVDPAAIRTSRALQAWLARSLTFAAALPKKAPRRKKAATRP